jgi:hypothetical protein
LPRNRKINLKATLYFLDHYCVFKFEIDKPRITRINLLLIRVQSREFAVKNIKKLKVKDKTI